MSGKHRICCLLAGLLLALAARCETVVVPGTVNSLCYYGDFFYNLPESDFLYYFNDALVFSEPPDDTIYESRMRDKYLRLVRRHRQVKEFIAREGNRENASVSFDLNDLRQFEKAAALMSLMGMELKGPDARDLQLQPRAEEDAADYPGFLGLDVPTLETQLRNTKKFFFKLPETRVALPWDMDLLARASGLALDGDSFFEQMLADKRLSQMMAVMFRLSDEEIAFLGHGDLRSAAPAWNRIYLDKRLTLGLLALSSALRVSQGRLQLPGGEAARAFWSTLAGGDPDRDPFAFLSKLSTMDGGKLNYLYVFSFFLPEAKRRVLLCDYDPSRFQRLYQKIQLGENEKIRAKAFPRLETFSFYPLLHILEVRDGVVSLPMGVPAWARAMKLDPPEEGDWLSFLERLLEASGVPGKKTSLLNKFITVYSRLSGRPALLTPDVLDLAFSGFESHQTMWDYIDRIPLRQADSVKVLLTWQDRIHWLAEEEQRLYTALVQSLLEAIAHAASFAPDGIDFDAVVRMLAELPLERPAFYDGLFAFLAGLDASGTVRPIADDAMLRFVLSGLKNQLVSVRNESYLWRGWDMALDGLQEMMNEQEVCTLSALGEINAQLDELARPREAPAGLARRLRQSCEMLPYPDFSRDAPKSLRDRVIPFERDELDRGLRGLLKLSEKNGGPDALAAAIAEFKGKYLLPLAKDHFLALAYALNAKSPKLRIFLNPNLARLHDFSSVSVSPWVAACGPGDKADFSVYYLRGGLSRLGLALAANWRGQLFEKNIINGDQAQALVFNILTMLPQPAATQIGSHDALLVELAIEMLTRCRQEEAVCEAAREAAFPVVCGYHRRRLFDYLSGAASDYYLFYSELRRIGALLAEREPILEAFSRREDLASYRKPPLSERIAAESDAWSGVFASSRGTLTPKNGFGFPQEVAQLFGSGWPSGEAIDEFKIKAAFLAQQGGYPTVLSGQFVFDFISTVGRSIYSQNHAKDYHSTYFVLDIMNIGHLKSTLKKLQNNGFLRLR